MRRYGAAAGDDGALPHQDDADAERLGLAASASQSTHKRARNDVAGRRVLARRGLVPALVEVRARTR